MNQPAFAPNVDSPANDVEETENVPRVSNTISTIGTISDDFGVAEPDAILDLDVSQSVNVEDSATLIDTNKTAPKRTIEQIIDNLIYTPPNIPSPATMFDVKNRWECYVTGVDDETFKAIAKDMDNPTAPKEEIVVDLDEVQADIDLVTVGAIFRWHIGYIDDENGQRTHASRYKIKGVSIRSKGSVSIDNSISFSSVRFRPLCIATPSLTL